MKIKVKNLGALKQAEFELGELTIICGGNNTGKTYATYALFGFLDTWQNDFQVDIPDEQINILLKDGTMQLDLEGYSKQAHELFKKYSRRYTIKLSKIFSAKRENFKETHFQVSLADPKIKGIFEQKTRATNTEIFSISKAKDSSELVVSLLIDQKEVKIPTDLIKNVISNAIIEVLFKPSLPRPFISSAERTGAAIFRKELDLARNRLLEEISRKDTKFNPTEFLFRRIRRNLDYALPVERNVDFARELESIAKEDSFIAEEYPQILNDFADIIGGDYKVSRHNGLHFKPKGKALKLTMDESSSAVRSLLDIGFYLRHVAQPGDLLMVDEPELNLHPRNQCRVARLFTQLVNIGVKVFITTHSDYIVKELNTLIMLNQNKRYLRRIARKEGYKAKELIAAEKIRVYIAEEALIKQEGNKKKSKCQTLTKANIDQQQGIEVRSFDETINEMNRIQEEIMWGEDE